MKLITIGNNGYIVLGIVAADTHYNSDELNTVKSSISDSEKVSTETETEKHHPNHILGFAVRFNPNQLIQET